MEPPLGSTGTLHRAPCGQELYRALTFSQISLLSLASRSLSEAEVADPKEAVSVPGVLPPSCSCRCCRLSFRRLSETNMMDGVCFQRHDARRSVVTWAGRGPEEAAAAAARWLARARLWHLQWWPGRSGVAGCEAAATTGCTARGAGVGGPGAGAAAAGAAAAGAAAGGPGAAWAAALAAALAALSARSRSRRVPPEGEEAGEEFGGLSVIGFLGGAGFPLGAPLCRGGRCCEAMRTLQVRRGQRTKAERV